jgi:hypothetical protein
MRWVSLLAVLALVGPVAGGQVASGPSDQGSHSAATIALVPDSPTFRIEDVQRGAVGFTARIRNEGPVTLTIAHPAMCFPADYEPGDTRRREDSHGHSEILLTIVRPDGERVVLRDGFFGLFEPGNTDHLVIGPGEVASFHLGWFFPNARGKWENDERAWTLFADEGEYRASVLFRNEFPKAWIRRESTGRGGFVPVWTGELKSDEVRVTVEPARE